MIILKVTFICAVIVNAFAQWVQFSLVRMAKKGKAGSEIIAIGLAPLFLAAFVLCFVGGGSGLWWAIHLDGTISMAIGILAGLLLLRGLLGVIGLAKEFLEGRKHKEVLSQDEMIQLIRSGQVERFTRISGEVTVTYFTYYENGQYLWRPHRADPDGYPAYVAQADSMGAGPKYSDHN